MKEKIKIAIVGLGQRGYTMLPTFLSTNEYEIIAVCDVYQDRIDKTVDYLLEKGEKPPKTYINFEDLIKNREIEAVYVATSWEDHIHQSIRCMEAGIPVGMEVGGAYSIRDCWKLVKAYEKTKTPIMLLENCCFDKFELLSTSLVRKGMLGDIVYCHGAYSHDLRGEITGGNINRHYRLRNYISRNCENYPTHELGPIAKLLNINRGNRLVSVSSFATPSKGLEQFIDDERCIDKNLKGQKFKQGDIVTTTIMCENGEVITMTLDTTLPTYYSRDFIVRGTKGLTKQENDMILIDKKFEEEWQPDPSKFLEANIHNAKDYSEYLPECWKNRDNENKDLWHGGMDVVMLEEFARCLKNKLPMPIDVYDAAMWYCITPLSEKSIKHHGKPYKIPDFTKGKYKTNKPLDVVKL
ncbi:MAG: Gfo/Idh/MocA family oxidoreductase [Bacilli bacterium]|nr:Gfo/Idh/MocA family oxidoreductase [Bacilli bacterium]